MTKLNRNIAVEIEARWQDRVNPVLLDLIEDHDSLELIMDITDALNFIERRTMNAKLNGGE